MTSSQNRHGNRDVTATTSRRCEVTSSDWTPCSRSCDVGTSIRLTNDNEDCRMQTQVRLCLVRPCAVRFPDVSFYSHFTIISLTSRHASLHVHVGPLYSRTKLRGRISRSSSYRQSISALLWTRSQQQTIRTPLLLSIDRTDRRTD